MVAVVVGVATGGIGVAAVGIVLPSTNGTVV